MPTAFAKYRPFPNSLDEQIQHHIISRAPVQGIIKLPLEEAVYMYNCNRAYQPVTGASGGAIRKPVLRMLPQLPAARRHGEKYDFSGGRICRRFEAGMG